MKCIYIKVLDQNFLHEDLKTDFLFFIFRVIVSLSDLVISAEKVADFFQQKMWTKSTLLGQDGRGVGRNVNKYANEFVWKTVFVETAS